MITLKLGSIGLQYQHLAKQLEAFEVNYCRHYIGVAPTPTMIKTHTERGLISTRCFGGLNGGTKLEVDRSCGTEELDTVKLKSVWVDGQWSVVASGAAAFRTDGDAVQSADCRQPIIVRIDLRQCYCHCSTGV
jgi:hypothetical protein